MSSFDTIVALLQEKMDIDPTSITMDTTFDDLNLDSLDMVELVCAYEDESGKDFGDPEDLATVRDLCDYIDSL